MKNLYAISHLFITLILICSASQTFAQPETLEGLQAEVEAVLNETGAPAIGIALVENGEAVWVDAQGLADLESQNAATQDTLFRMGSVSKMFAGVAVMQLVEKGVLSLEDRLADRIPEFVFDNPWEKTHPIRIAHLLEHTTGWDVHLGEYAGEAPDSLSLKDGLNLHTDSRVSRWVPGTRHTYSNTGPVVAARVVEEVSGLAFEEYVKKNIFTPLNMASSSFLKTPTYDERGATNYTANGPAEYLHIFSRPSSSLNTSPKDMVNFLKMFIARGAHGEHSILSSDAIERMQRSETTLGYQAGIHAGYGLTVDAFGFQDWNTSFYGHTGGLPGAVSEFIYQPELESGYLFMINQQNPAAFHRLSNTLRSYLLRNSIKPEPQTQALPAAFKHLNGYYRPINPIFDLGRIQFDITQVMKFSTDEKALHRSPFFGGWTSNDYAPKNASGQYLVSDWSGLPSVAIVQDPLAGEAVQVEGVLYKKTSAVLVYGRLVCIAISMILVLGSLIYVLFWLPQSLWRKALFSSQNSVRGTVLVSSLLLVSLPLALVMTGSDPKLLMQSQMLMGGVFAISLAYPVVVLLSVIQWQRSKHSITGLKEYPFSTLCISAHLFITAYLISYGLLPFRMWA